MSVPPARTISSRIALAGCVPVPVPASKLAFMRQARQLEQNTTSCWKASLAMACSSTPTELQPWPGSGTAKKPRKASCRDSPSSASTASSTVALARNCQPLLSNRIDAAADPSEHTTQPAFKAVVFAGPALSEGSEGLAKSEKARALRMLTQSWTSSSEEATAATSLQSPSQEDRSPSSAPTAVTSGRSPRTAARVFTQQSSRQHTSSRCAQAASSSSSALSAKDSNLSLRRRRALAALTSLRSTSDALELRCSSAMLATSRATSAAYCRRQADVTPPSFPAVSSHFMRSWKYCAASCSVPAVRKRVLPLVTASLSPLC
mmetsp:Transcript_12363/g.16991  ORF Transcript_12363/g.16991 Transcript_12363/m.16991 type:complete len:319 (-) Transcript_12363:1139-2095(-)